MAVKASAVPLTTLHIYTRVSTAHQRDEGTSLQTQLDQGKRRAKELGFKFEHWDEGGKSSHHEDIADRPKLNALYQSIKAGVVKHLFVYDQSRLSRNDSVASIFRYECDKQGVTLYTKDGQFDLSNPQDKFLKQILDGLSEFDNAVRSERTRLGKINRARGGFWHGGPPPFGYVLQEKKLAIQSKEATWVKRIFAECRKGTSTQAIKQLLDTKGVPPRRGGMWTLGSILALLRNTHYVGHYVFHDKKSDEKITIRCPSIVEEAEWRAVQVAKSRKSSRTQQKNRTKRFYLLRDLMFCGHCGRPISGRQRPSKSEALYYCPNKERDWASKGGTANPWKRGTGCGMDRSLSIPEADRLIFNIVQDVHRGSSVLREKVKRSVLGANGIFKERSATETKNLHARIKRLSDQLAQARDVLGSIEATFELGEMDKKVFEAKKRTVVSRLSEIEFALTSAKSELKGSTEDRKWVDWYKAYGDEVSSKADLADEQKRDYIDGLVERIQVRYLKQTDEHELTVRFRLPIVNDGIRYKDPKRRALGYDLYEGDAQTKVMVAPKRRSLAQSRRRVRRKKVTPEENNSVTVE